MFRSIAVAAILICCNQINAQIDIDGDYAKKHAIWQQELRQGRNNYLKLVALEPVGDSISFGASKKADLKLEMDNIPPIVGTYVKVGGTVMFREGPQVEVKDASGIPIAGDVALIPLDDYGATPKMFYGDLSWRIITRGGQLYLRMWHESNPAVTAFKGFEWFALDKDMIFEGQFEYYDNIQSDTVRSKLGVTENTNFVGTLTFNNKGSEHEVRVGRGGFLMLSDETTGGETYGGGRYIYIELPEEDGPLTLDLNYLYNPPCSFSELTTCLIPPPDNRLPFAVYAGESLIRLK